MYAMEDRLNYKYNYNNTNSNNSNDNVNMRNKGDTINNDGKNRRQFYEKPCKTCYK